MATVTSRGISLANKCQLLFGLAVLLILTAALSVPWFRMEWMVERHQFEVARQLADGWLSNVIEMGSSPASERGLVLRVLTLDQLQIEAGGDPFLGSVLTALESDAPDRPAQPVFSAQRRGTAPATYRYARPLHADDIAGVQDPAFAQYNADLPDPEIANPVWGVFLVDMGGANAMRQLFINRTYIILAGIMAGSLAILVFYFITTRLILSPVRVLKETADLVARGNLNIRSAISTGDEFEELSDTFNLMLSNLKSSQDQLRQINKSLDLRLSELAESNVMLHEANRLKSEFLANVSHELRTPLSSILGFAEVIADAEAAMPAPKRDDRRARYAENILTSGRSLLGMINNLLDLAKIEAGRVQLQPEMTNVVEVCAALMTLIRPQAEKKTIELRLDLPQTLPPVETDAAKFQQVIFNLLSNAVKFTPQRGTVTLSAQRIHSSGLGETLRVTVTDTGPGISREDQEVVFEKFRQVDASHTRPHAGTGLGLAICKELLSLLGGDIEVDSQPGCGATFIVTIPFKFRIESPQSLMS